MRQLLLAGVAVTALGACGPGLDSLAPYTIGGAVTGLTGTLVLQNNGGDNLSIAGNGSFKFKTELASDAAYAVSVLTQPSGQICTVSSGSGTATANVTTVSVLCASSTPSLPPYAIGGTISGLTGTVVLQNNALDNFSTSTNGNFTFSTKLLTVGPYAVTVLTQPSGQVCTVSNGSGTAIANVNTVSVQCLDVTPSPAPYSVGGTISGLTGTVVLQNNGLDDLSLTTNGSFTFNTKLLAVGPYAVTVLTQPSSQICTVRNGSGTAIVNITTVSINCTGTRQLGVANAYTFEPSVATDSSGNIYVAGSTFGGLDGNTLMGTTDFFVTKYNSSGAYQFTKQSGVANSSTRGKSVATDSNGNVYVAGYTSGGLDGNTLTGTIDFFVTKYNSSGVYQYTKQFGVVGAYTFGTSVAIDSTNNVYVAGYTTGRLDTDPLMGTTDFFVTKYSSDGVKQFTRQLGVAGKSTFGNSVATDTGGNIYVAGSTYGGLDNNTLMGTSGFSDIFVTKYDSSGAKQYTKQLGVANVNTVGTSVATDTIGNIYVAGTTNGGLDNNALMGTTGYSDFFVTKYNSSGVKQYTRQLGVATADTLGNSVTTDASGNVFVAGQTNGGLDGNTLTGTSDFFLTKYNSAGVKQFTRQLGVFGASTYGNSVATDASGNVFVAGETNGGFDGNTLTGTTDFFVTKFNSSGVKQ